MFSTHGEEVVGKSWCEVVAELSIIGIEHFSAESLYIEMGLLHSKDYRLSVFHEVDWHSLGFLS